jgi:oxygen-dependent protoporphyrinogen oxidase
MISVYFTDGPSLRPFEADDAILRERAVAAVESTFSDACGKTLFVHIVRWGTAIPRFPPGRMTEMAALRRRLASWSVPIDLCGDYLDGLSSEGALRTGEQAAERLAGRWSGRTR